MVRNHQVEQYIHIIEERTGVPRSSIVSLSRRSDVVKARWVLCWFLRNKLGMSTPVIGEIIKKDHTSVLHALKHAEKHLSQFQDLVDMEVELGGTSGSKSNPGSGQSAVQKWKYVYEHFGGKCCVCGYNDIVEVHHIIPKRMGGTDLLANLLLFCPNHHQAYHAGLVNISKLETGNPQEVHS